MPITLHSLVKKVAHVSVPYDGDTVEVDYFPSKVTEKVFAQLQSFNQTNETNLMEGFAGLNSALISLVKTWDVFEDEDKTIPYPLTAESLADLPVGFRLQIVSSIMGDIRPNEHSPQTTQN